jgi:hypothetical protein
VLRSILVFMINTTVTKKLSVSTLCVFRAPSPAPCRLEPNCSPILTYHLAIAVHVIRDGSHLGRNTRISFVVLDFW